MSLISLELRSEITPAGQLRVSLEEREVAPPGPDEVVVRVEAAPVNPADLARLIGPADLATLSSEGTVNGPSRRRAEVVERDGNVYMRT